MTEPNSEPPVEYPSSWRPDYIKERDDGIEPLAAEAWIASLSDREFQSLIQRTRRDR